MGILGKIKNVLFEEEEIEIPVFQKEEKKEEKSKPIKKINESVIKKEEKKPLVKQEIKKEEKKEIIKEDNERETFKTEPTFQFPVFDETEFNEPKKTRSNNILEKKTNRKKIDFGKYDSPKPEKEESKKFVPSPVISPVFGILDKNYTKKDIKPKKEAKAKVVNIDDVRNKAYGTIEEEIEKTIEKQAEEFYKEEPTKSINELLIDSIDEEIDVKEEKENSQSLEILDDIKKDIDNDKLEDTLESDLFNLIDSMYTNKEEK